MVSKRSSSSWRTAAFFVSIAIFTTLIFSLLLPARASVAVTVPYSTTPIADSDLDGDPSTGAWSDAASYTIPLENGADPPYGTAMLYVKHDGTYVYYRIDGSIDVAWISTTGEHFWLGIVISESGTSHHGGGATWDGIFFGESNYSPEPTYPPTPVDTYGFSKPPTKDVSQDALGSMQYSGSAVPFDFTAEWKKALNTGDADDIALVTDGATTYNFFVTTDSNGKGSSGGAIDHNVVPNLNTMKFEAPPTTVHDVAVTEVTASPSTVIVGETVTVSVTVENQGTVSETFDVTAYYDSTPVGTQTVTVASSGSTSLTFSWDTTGVAPGTYTISAEALLVGDDDPGDNSYTDDTVTVEAPPTVVHDVAITGVTASPTTAIVGETVTVTVTAENQGTEGETFDVTAYYDSNAISTQTVTLSAGVSTSLIFSWDTTNVAPGSYLISAEALLAGDDDPGDNSYTDDTVTLEEAPPSLIACELAGIGRKPGSILPSGEMTFKGRVKNRGTVDVEFYIEFVIKDPSGSEVGSVSTQISVELVDDGPTSISVTWTVPLDVASGTYSVEGTLYYKEVGSGDTWIQGETLLTGFKVRG